MELLVVLVLVGLLAGLGIPRFVGSLKKAEVRAAASRISSALRGGRILALEKKGIYKVVLDMEKGLAFPVKSSGEEGMAGDPLTIPEGTVLWEKGSRITRAEVEFYPTGSSNGAELFVTDGEASGYEQKNAYAVAVDLLSGRTVLKPAQEYLDEKGPY